MKKTRFPVFFKTSLLLLACAAILAFSAGKHAHPGDNTNSPASLTEAQFHDHIAGIINGEGISQKELAQMMLEAEKRISGRETASDYIENYMNAHFKAAPSTTNRVSIASPGQSDLNMSVACNQTALQTLTSGAIGYYYAFAARCNGTYTYDGKNYTGGSTVYVRAEASTNILEAFILF